MKISMPKLKKYEVDEAYLEGVDSAKRTLAASAAIPFVTLFLVNVIEKVFITRSSHEQSGEEPVVIEQ